MVFSLSLHKRGHLEGEDDKKIDIYKVRLSSLTRINEKSAVNKWFSPEQVIRSRSRRETALMAR